MSARKFDIKKAKKYGNVRVFHEENRIVVRLHQTDIVVMSESGIRLNTNGWLTSTTKTAMNNALRQFGTSLYVHQSKRVWYVSFGNGVTVPYKDGMNIAIKNSQLILNETKAA